VELTFFDRLYLFIQNQNLMVEEQLEQQQEQIVLSPSPTRT
jgi:hypothetical protein